MKTNNPNLKNLFTYFILVLVVFTTNVLKADSITWLGGDASAPNSWKDANNWNTGTTPGSSDDVTIPSTSNNPTVDITATIESLTISQSGATLTLDGIHNLTVTGNVNVNSPGSKISTGKGSIIMGGSLSGEGTLDLTGNGTAEIGGDMTIETLSPGSGGKSFVVFNGTSQNITNSYQFNNLQVGISKAGVVNFLADQTINVSLSGCGIINCGNHILNLTGDMTVKTFNADSGTVNLTGYINSQSQDINGYVFYNLSVNNAKTYLNGNVSISHNLNFVSGNILLRSYNLTLASGSRMTWNGDSAVDYTSGYVVTCGSGYLTMNAKAGGTIFPIGYSIAEYNPVTLTGSSGNVAFDVSVSDGVTDAQGEEVTANAVNETWLIVPHAAVPSITIAPQWTNGSQGDTDQELAFFNRALAEVNERISETYPSAWTTMGPAGRSTGGDPWTRSSGSASMNANTTYYIYVSAGSIAPLPVTLTTFEATYQNGPVTLKWITASEINNSRFEIERSDDGAQWTTIGSVDGHGTTQEENAYLATDNLEGIVATGTVYYRLKQIDFNGTFNYSMIRPVNITSIPLSVEVFPIPVRDNLNVSWTNTVGTNTTIRIINTNGLTLYNVTNTGSGIMHEQINLGGYPIGNYILQVVCDAGITSKLIVKE